MEIAEIPVAKKRTGINADKENKYTGKGRLYAYIYIYMGRGGK